MTTDDFARRHGYREEHPVFKSPDFLPDKVRVDGGEMIVNRFDDLSDGMRFIGIVQDLLPPSDKLWEWRVNVPAPQVVYEAYPFYRVEIPTDKRVYSNASEHLVQPLRTCDWRLFYAVVEEVCAAWRRAGTDREVSFASDFNLLLRSYGIPWTLQGGWVIPVADSEFAEDLKHAREVAHPPVADHVKDPHESIRDALASLYRKQGGPDNNTAVALARDAWRAVVGAVSGCNPEEDSKRAFAYIQTHYPELNDTMEPWKDLMNAARHSANLEQRLPTEGEARFIVILCVNAVRLLCPTCRSEDAE